MSDLDNGFEKILEKLALKKSSNNEVFMHIQQGFMNAVKSDSFKEINEKYFQDKNSIVSNYAEIAIGIEQLRVKYKALKQDWSSIKNGTGHLPDKGPHWFKHSNPVFFEAN